MIKAKATKSKQGNDKENTRSTSHKKPSKKRKIIVNDSATDISVCDYAMTSCELIIFQLFSFPKAEEHTDVETENAATNFSSPKQSSPTTTRIESQKEVTSRY